MANRCLRCFQRSGFQQVAAVAPAKFLPQLMEPAHIVGMEQALVGGRDVQQKHGVAAHGFFIDVQQLFQRLHLIILAGMPEPARPDGGVHLRRVPDQVLFISQNGAAAQILIPCLDGALPEGGIICLLAVSGDFLRIDGAPRHHAPFGGAGVSCLVAAPADIRPAHMNAGIGLQVANHSIVTIPVIDLLFAIGAFPTGAIQPYSEDVPVAGEQLRQLGDKVIIVRLSRAVQRMMPVPWRQVHPEADTARLAGPRRFGHHIHRAGAGSHGVLRVAAGPQAETVVVLAGQNQASHASGFDGLHPLDWIQFRGVEQGRTFRAIAPFLVGKGVHGKVHEGVKAHLLRAQLPLRGLDADQPLIDRLHCVCSCGLVCRFAVLL